MCSTIDSGEKGYKLPKSILFNFLALFPTLFNQGKLTSLCRWQKRRGVWDGRYFLPFQGF